MECVDVPGMQGLVHVVSGDWRLPQVGRLGQESRGEPQAASDLFDRDFHRYHVVDRLDSSARL